MNPRTSNIWLVKVTHYIAENVRRKPWLSCQKGSVCSYIFLMPFWFALLISERFETRMEETRKPTPSNRYLRKKIQIVNSVSRDMTLTDQKHTFQLITSIWKLLSSNSIQTLINTAYFFLGQSDVNKTIYDLTQSCFPSRWMMNIKPEVLH